MIVAHRDDNDCNYDQGSEARREVILFKLF